MLGTVNPGEGWEWGVERGLNEREREKERERERERGRQDRADRADRRAWTLLDLSAVYT